MNIRCNITFGSEESRNFCKDHDYVPFMVAFVSDVVEKKLFSCIKKIASVNIIVDAPTQLENASKRYVSSSFGFGVYTITIDHRTPKDAFKVLLLKELFYVYLHLSGWLAYEYTKNGVLHIWKGCSFSTRLMDESNWPWNVEFQKWYDSLSK